MEVEIEVWLTDIVIAASQILEFTDGGSIQYEAFTKNLMLKKAVERNLEIIGEAANRISKKNPAFAPVNSRKMTDLRNRIIHSYEVISDETIYVIVKKHIEPLIAEVAAILKKHSK